MGSVLSGGTEFIVHLKGTVGAGFRLGKRSERSTAGLITLYVLRECSSKSRSEFGGNRLLKRNGGQVGGITFR